MIKVEVIENFTLEDYNKLKNVKKVISRKENEFGVRDTFECDEKMADYLTGTNDKGITVVKVIEVDPIKIKKELVKSLEEAPKEDKLTKEEIKYYTSKKKKSSKINRSI